MICPSCGENLSYSIERHHYGESGLENVWVDNVGIFKCACGQEYIQLPGLLQVQDRIAEQLIKKNSLLIGKEFKFLRKWLGLTSEELANSLGVDRGSISRWENEAVSVPADRLIRLFAGGTKNVTLDPQSYFRTIASEPDKDFSVVIDDLPLASSITFASEEATIFMTDTGSMSSTAITGFSNILSIARLTEGAANQELAKAA